MAKLHEILAVERNLQAVSNKLTLESKQTLGKDSLFRGMTRNLTHFSDTDQHLNLTETQELETTVGDNLDYLSKPWSEWIDATLEKDRGNMSAVADVEINGAKFLTDVPGMTLLGLESKLAALRDVLEAIPTLPPGVGWIEDKQAGEGVYMSRSSIDTLKEVKDTDFRRVAEATEQHPAQIQPVPINKAVGKYQVYQQCGMMAPIDKAAHLERLDTLLKAIKKARARANDQETKREHIGQALFDFIRGK